MDSKPANDLSNLHCSVKGFDYELKRIVAIRALPRDLGNVDENNAKKPIGTGRRNATTHGVTR